MHEGHPKRLDVASTGFCNLGCPFCWGPDHSIKGSLGQDEWFQLFRWGQSHLGIEEVCSTGGEPLLRHDAGMLMLAASLLGLRTTLSTNCLLLAEHAKRTWNVLNYVDEIGIPLDGSTPAKNALLRIGDPRQFDAALAAIQTVRKMTKPTSITARTVITRQNVDDILNIGDVLTRNPNAMPDEWKLYEFTPIGYGAKHQEEMRIPPQQFEDTVQAAIEKHGQTLLVRSQRSDIQSQKYLFVGPDGDFYAIGRNFEHIPLGNPFHLQFQVVTNIQNHYAQSR